MSQSLFLYPEQRQKSILSGWRLARGEGVALPRDLPRTNIAHAGRIPPNEEAKKKAALSAR